jgi:hypothetical protein
LGRKKRSDKTQIKVQVLSFQLTSFADQVEAGLPPDERELHIATPSMVQELRGVTIDQPHLGRSVATKTDFPIIWKSHLAMSVETNN